MVLSLAVLGCGTSSGGGAAGAKASDRKTEVASDVAGDQPAGAAKPLKWDRPRFKERQKERDWMIDAQMRDVTDKKVLQAMRDVPRHKFVPDRLQRSAYADRPLRIGHGQTISQAYIVAYMTEQLALKPGDKVLEIGTGSGYQAAVLSELTPKIFSVEIIKKLAGPAAKRLKDLGYKTIKTKHADGYYGWKEHAPFDAVIVTCATTHIPPPLVAQLKEGGRMCIPVGGPFSFQELVFLEKKDGKVHSRSLIGVRFVPLTRK